MLDLAVLSLWMDLIRKDLKDLFQPYDSISIILF